MNNSMGYVYGKIKVRITKVFTIWKSGVVMKVYRMLLQILQKYMIIANIDRTFLRRNLEKMRDCDV